MPQNRWTNSFSTYRLGELDFFNKYVLFLLPAPREYDALWILPSKPESPTDHDVVTSRRPPTCYNSIFTIFWKLHNQGSKGPGITHPHWCRGIPNARSPNVTQRSFAPPSGGFSADSVACFQKYLQEWHIFVLCGRDLSIGNNKCLLEPSLVNDLGNKAEKWYSKSKMESTIHLILQSSPFSSGSQVSGTRIVVPYEISHAFQNLPTPYAEWSVAPLNGEQLRPLVCFVPLCGPLSEQRCIIQCFLHWEFSWGRSCFCCQLLFWIQKTIPRVHIHIFNWAVAILMPPFLPLSPYPLLTTTLLLSGFDCFVF